MKVFNFQDIVRWEPCYSPSRFLSTDWEGTALDIIKKEEIPWTDRLWVVCREELIDTKTLRLFAVFCARQVEHLLTNERSKNAIDVAERFANGLASKDSLRVARCAAWESIIYKTNDPAKKCSMVRSGGRCMGFSKGCSKGRIRGRSKGRSAKRTTKETD